MLCAGVIYPEFHYDAPPPTYDASISDSRLSQIDLTTGALSVTNLSHLSESMVADNISVTASTPPSYRSRASSFRSNILSCVAAETFGDSGLVATMDTQCARNSCPLPPHYDQLITTQYSDRLRDSESGRQSITSSRHWLRPSVTDSAHCLRCLLQSVPPSPDTKPTVVSWLIMPGTEWASPVNNTIITRSYEKIV